MLARGLMRAVARDLAQGLARDLAQDLAQGLLGDPRRLLADAGDTLPCWLFSRSVIG